MSKVNDNIHGISEVFIVLFLLVFKLLAAGFSNLIIALGAFVQGFSFP